MPLRGLVVATSLWFFPAAPGDVFEDRAKRILPGRPSRCSTSKQRLRSAAAEISWSVDLLAGRFDLKSRFFADR
jgi:hypothetical protein